MAVVRSARRVRLFATLLVPLLLATAHSAGPPASDPLPLVYVSGLDDHLLPAYERVPMHAVPGGAVTGHAPIDSLAWVHDEVGGWLDIELVGPGPGAASRGWVADFYLRGELHVVDPQAPGCPISVAHVPGDAPHHHALFPSTLVRLLDVAEHDARTWVLVRSINTGMLSWVDRASLSERPGPDIRRAASGTPCRDIQPEPVVPHTH